MLDKIAESLEGDITIEPDWLSEHVGVLPEDRVRLDPEVWAKLAVYITERQWHPSQEFLTRPDGRIEMRLETAGRKELVRWVLSWMPDVKVIVPKSLRDRITEKLRDGLWAQQ